MSYPGLGITRIQYDGSNLSHYTSLHLFATATIHIIVPPTSSRD